MLVHLGSLTLCTIWSQIKVVQYHGKALARYFQPMSLHPRYSSIRSVIHRDVVNLIVQPQKMAMCHVLLRMTHGFRYI
jgi:hypothetical protein